MIHQHRVRKCQDKYVQVVFFSNIRSRNSDHRKERVCWTTRPLFYEGNDPILDDRIIAGLENRLWSWPCDACYVWFHELSKLGADIPSSRGPSHVRYLGYRHVCYSWCFAFPSQTKTQSWSFPMAPWPPLQSSSYPCKKYLYFYPIDCPQSP